MPVFLPHAYQALFHFSNIGPRLRLWQSHPFSRIRSLYVLWLSQEPTHLPRLNSVSRDRSSMTSRNLLAPIMKASLVALCGGYCSGVDNFSAVLLEVSSPTSDNLTSPRPVWDPGGKPRLGIGRRPRNKSLGCQTQALLDTTALHVANLHSWSIAMVLTSQSQVTTAYSRARPILSKCLEIHSAILRTCGKCTHFHLATIRINNFSMACLCLCM